jgi:uncharacterized membrane protein YdbT with pleckstrin-like domain
MEGVVLPAKLLGADEQLVIHTRTHVKAMILPALAFVLIAAVLAIWLVLLPFLRWRTTTYTITSRRLITRSGILNKIGKDLPLNRINEVSYERSLLDRMLGCGSLNVQTAAEDGTIVLRDVPDVEHVSHEVTQLLVGPQGTQHPPAARS